MKRGMMRGLLAATFAVSAGFGVVQALAAPAEAQAAARCDPDACTRRCAREGLIGFCDGRGCWCR